MDLGIFRGRFEFRNKSQVHTAFSHLFFENPIIIAEFLHFICLFRRFSSIGITITDIHSSKLRTDLAVGTGDSYGRVLPVAKQSIILCSFIQHLAAAENIVSHFLHNLVDNPLNITLLVAMLCKFMKSFNL